MGKKEDLVRARLAKEERERLAEAERQAAEKRSRQAALQKRFEALLAAADQEAARLAERLEETDWAQAVLVRFRMPKRHWWQWGEVVEYACLSIPGKDAYLAYSPEIWLRSDGVLYLSGGYTFSYGLLRPGDFFHQEMMSWKEWFNTRLACERLSSVLSRLKEYQRASR